MGFRVLRRTGHPAAEHRLRVGRLASGAVRLDRREVLGLEDCAGNLDNALTRDQVLDNIMLYWLPRTGASSARLYGESIRQVNAWISGPAADTITVPTGCSIFPKALQRPS